MTAVETATPTPTECHAAAHTYAALGWRVVPIKPGTKRPIPGRWQQLATLNPDQINRWWTDHPDAGVGIATGQGLCVIDIDQHDTNGWDNWVALCDQHNQPPTPDTVIACTGGGGWHLLYTVPTNTRISNGAATRLPAGIDVRGDGGQIVAPPTIHTTGTPYAWAAGHAPDETPVAGMPLWLLDILTGPHSNSRGPEFEPLPHSPTPVGSLPGDRPGDRWAAATTWDTLLTATGAIVGPPDREGRRSVTRPGKHPTEGTSATLWTASDTLKMFTTNWPPFEAERTYSKLGFYAALHHAGDTTAAARALAAAGYGTPIDRSDPADLIGATLTTGAGPKAPAGPPEADSDESDQQRSSWLNVDFADALNGTLDPVLPDVLPIDGGPHHIFYRGRLNTIVGESETLKTWTALIACLTEIQTGNTVWWFDGEDTVTTSLSRLRALGAADQQLLDYFRWWGPDTRPSQLEWLALLDQLHQDRPSLITVDSFDEMAGWWGITDTWRTENVIPLHQTWRQLSRPHNSAVVFIDHQPKNKEGGSRWAGGSQRKISGLDGISIVQEGISPFGQNRRGRAKVTIGKDRPGGLRGNVQNDGKTIGVLDMESFPDGSITWTLAPEAAPPNVADGKPGTQIPTIIMTNISELLEDHPQGFSVTELEGMVSGYSRKIRAAVAMLRDLGHVKEVRVGRNRPIQLIKPYPGD